MKHKSHAIVQNMQFMQNKSLAIVQSNLPQQHQVGWVGGSKTMPDPTIDGKPNFPSYVGSDPTSAY
jgi:hypothetical protein